MFVRSRYRALLRELLGAYNDDLLPGIGDVGSSFLRCFQKRELEDDDALVSSESPGTLPLANGKALLSAASGVSRASSADAPKDRGWIVESLLTRARQAFRESYQRRAKNHA